MAPHLALDVVVDPAIFQRWPGYRAGIVHAAQVRNEPSDDHSRRLLAAAQRCRARLGERPITADAHIAAWRDAYRDFGAKPSRYRSSAEALARRALGAGLPAVNAVVDLYNAVSVAHLIPLGGEDLAGVRGAVRLRTAGAGEPFETREEGAPAVVGVDAGEVVWADDAGVTCRRWNWRQCTRTELTAGTTDAYFVFDALPPCDDAALAAAMDELVAGLHERSPGAAIDTMVLRAGATGADG
ncbi:MAG TPA: phenylalanine--tRNA ligase beta subunit-related protein [Euzebyales bacterium]|nr:phenylalanine--tRNA ligase beta subunit-related protein [Euzebyales bacterium]